MKSTRQILLMDAPELRRLVCRLQIDIVAHEVRNYGVHVTNGKLQRKKAMRIKREVYAKTVRPLVLPMAENKEPED